MRGLGVETLRFARECVCLLSLWGVAYGVKGSDWKIKAVFLELFLTFIYLYFIFLSQV